MGGWDLIRNKKSSLRWRDYKDSKSSEINSRNWFLKGISCRLDNDRNIMFWHCNWFGGVPLRLVFPLLFMRSSFPHATIMKMRVLMESTWYWHFKGDLTSLTDLERVQGKELQAILMNVAPVVDIKNTFIWFTNAERNYFFRKGYVASIKKVNESTRNIEVVEAMASIWKTKVPSKVQVFIWRCLKDRIPTKEQLFKRGNF